MSLASRDDRGGSSAEFLDDAGSTRIFTLTTEAEGEAVGDALIISPFGTSAHELFTMALYLSVNGFNVTRFDGRNHVGRGTGEIRNFRLSQLEADVATVIHRRVSSRLPLILIGISLSAPVAWRAALRSERVAGVASLVGVVDVRDTVLRVAGADMDVYGAPGSRSDAIVEVFGYPILATPFSRDSCQSRYTKLADTIDTVSRLRCPVQMIAGASDDYVDVRLVERVASHLPSGSALSVLNGINHEIGRSVSATKLALSELVARCATMAGQTQPSVILPKITELVRRSGVESSYLRRFDEEAHDRSI